MKYLSLILLLTIQLFALNIMLNSAKENGLPYAILHIVDSDMVECQEINVSLEKKSYICKFNKIVKTPLEKKELRLVNIDFLEKKSRFYLKIEPKVKSKIIPINEYLYEKSEVTSEYSTKKTHHWVILLYEQLPFGKDNTLEEGINFPVTYDKYLKPSIGAVDLNGAPIYYAKSKDINFYIDIQKEFNKGDYENTIKDVDKVLKQYPKSIFKSELLLYKLKSLMISLDKNIEPISDEYTTSDILSLGKRWLKEFPSNEDIPEVLYILAKGYLKSGFSSDANYFLDILITEHENSKYTKKAILFFADTLFDKNEKDKAIKLYEDVLYSAKDLDIASEAAIRLANSNMSIGKSHKAKEYLSKVLKANKNYLLKDRDATYKLAKKLAKNHLFKIAAEVGELLLENMNKRDEKRELLLKELGDWYAKSNQIEKAYKKYEQYKKEYSDGLYMDEVQKSLDKLFFQLNETDEKRLLKYYDMLIKKYDNEISDKAKIEKAKLLLKIKKYQKILDMADTLKVIKDGNTSKGYKFVKSAAKFLVIENIKSKECQKAVNLFESYKLDLKDINDTEDFYNCLIKTSRYKIAEKLVNKKLKIKDLNKKFNWLEKYIEVEYELQKFDKVIELKKDIFSLSTVLNKKIKAQILRYFIDVYIEKDMLNKALSVVSELEKNYKDDIKNIDLFFKIARYANEKKDDILLVKFAQKTIELENKYKVFYLSPSIDFLYIEALKRLNRLKDAKKIALKLLDRKIDAKARVRALYLLGELSLKLKKSNEAKEYFKKCSKIDVKSSWKSLCEDSLKLF